MTDSAFDPAQFLDATTTEANTRLPPLPPGDYLATLEDLKLEDWQSRDGQKAGKKFTVQLAVDPSSNMSAVKTGTFEGIKTLRVQDSIMLDTTPQGLDMGQGKNTGLRRYRDAMNLNAAGQPFAPRMMIGRQLKVKIKHREYQGELFNEVDAVTRP